MSQFQSSIRPLLFSIIMLLCTSGLSYAAELDDSSLFVEAFNASKNRDYLLSVNKTSQLNQLFPDSPLRDISLLLLARSAFKAGDNALAARTVNRYLSEFSSNPLTGGIEDELLKLGGRLKNGEALTPNKQLQAAAQKIRNEQLAMERAAALKAEQERLAREQAERERIAREKAEAERRERERLAAIKADRESIRLTLRFPGDGAALDVGREELLPVELLNRSKQEETFVLTAKLPSEYGAVLMHAGGRDALGDRVTIAAGETLKASLKMRMPAGRVDGFRLKIPLSAVSARYSDIAFAQEMSLKASAPLLRGLVRAEKQKASDGEWKRFRVVLLNAGSMTARELSAKAVLPKGMELAEPDRHESAADTALFKVEQLAAGAMAEFRFRARLTERSLAGKKLQCAVEIVNGQLQLKEKSLSAPFVFAAGK